MDGLSGLLVLVEGRIDARSAASALEFASVNEPALSLSTIVAALIGDRRIDPEVAQQVLIAAGDLGMKQDEDIVEFRDWLASRDARTDGPGVLRRTALHYAALEGDVHQARSLLAGGADPSRADARGDAPLHLAVRSGSVPIVEILLDHGAEVDAVGSLELTPLHHAVSGGCDLIRVLLAAGADPQFGLARRQTPLGLARMSGDREAIELLESALSARHRSRG